MKQLSDLIEYINNKISNIDSELSKDDYYINYYYHGRESLIKDKRIYDDIIRFMNGENK